MSFWLGPDTNSVFHARQFESRSNAWTKDCSSNSLATHNPLLAVQLRTSLATLYDLTIDKRN